MIPFLFVYGTLQPDAESKLGLCERRMLQSEGIFLGPASTCGALLDLGDYPGLMQGPDLVHGAVYRLSDPDMTLKWLDAYEGITIDRPNEYRRLERQVMLVGGQLLNAWTYVFIGNSYGLCKIASGRWQHRLD